MEDNIRFSHDLAEYMQRPQYSADMIHQKALEWIDSQSDAKPFFGMLTYTLPHAELVGPADSLYRSYEKTFRNSPDWKAYIGSRYHSTDNVHAQYAAMVTRLDAYVGEIIDLLERKGLDKNTLIFFSSDNGPHQEGGGDPEFFNSNGGLKGIKRQTHEGGIRVPFIAYWPGTISGGQVSEFPIIFYDIMPTLIELTGAEKVKTDGISILPAIIGNEDENQEREFLYWEFEETDQVALRQGDWKLICKSGVPHLYNLLQDPSEQTDLADQYPELVAQMIETIRGQHTESPHFKVTIP
jgi:arylsulfatase A-like enzyme